MIAERIRTVFLLAACGASAPVFAQAPSSAQVWDVRFVVDSVGAFAAGPAATAVGITIMARVGILPNTSASGTANFGVSRVGGSGSATSGFRVVFTDAENASTGRNQGSVFPSETGDSRTLDPVTGAFSITGVATLLRDTSGEPLRGHFAPFRGSFNPQVSPLFLGSNTDPMNGGVLNPATGSPVLFNLVGSRVFNFGSTGDGPLGAFTPSTDPIIHPVGTSISVYRMLYMPSPGSVRSVALQSLGQTGRYIHTIDTSVRTAQSTIPNISGTFVVPAPGELGIVAICACRSVRRRRRGRR